MNLGEFSIQTFILSLLVTMAIILRHLSNIKRLIQGEEIKIQFK
jgi:glycerol-3-phosphate acyltransferase PlsY